MKMDAAPDASSSSTPKFVGKVQAPRRPAAPSGGKLGLGDSLIAGVAADLCATVVTRNRPDFELQAIEVATSRLDAPRVAASRPRPP